MSFVVSVCIAVDHDRPGLWATLVSLREQIVDDDLEDKVEIVVCNNAPNSAHTAEIKSDCKSIPNCRYIEESKKGSAVAKNAAIAAAMGKAILQIDSHVFLRASNKTLKKVVEFWENSDSDDLYFGPLIHQSLTQKNYFPERGEWGVRDCLVSTHLYPEWSEDNASFGKWRVNGIAYDTDAAPFEIYGSGCGCFTAKRATWLGFDPQSRGFGMEEAWLPDQYRKHGRKVYCLPPLRWVHRFLHGFAAGEIRRDGSSAGGKFYDRCFNLLRCAQEFGRLTVADIRWIHVRYGRLSCKRFDDCHREVFSQPAPCEINKPRLLLLVPTAINNHERRAAVRETWWKKIDAVKKLFVICNPDIKEPVLVGDTLQINSPEGYHQLTNKIPEMLNWAHGYDKFDYLFKCDDDTYVHGDRMTQFLATYPDEYVGHDYGGFASGGAGYLLSREAVGCLAFAPRDPEPSFREEPWMAAILKKHNISVTNRSDLFRGEGENWPEPGNMLITGHYLKPDKLREIHKNFYGN